MLNPYEPTDMERDLRKIVKGLFGQHEDKFEAMKLYEHPPYTFVEITGKDGRVALGIAKCNPTDTYDSLIGAKTAIHRAVEHFFSQKHRHTQLHAEFI